MHRKQLSTYYKVKVRARKEFYVGLPLKVGWRLHPNLGSVKRRILVPSSAGYAGLGFTGLDWTLADVATHGGQPSLS